MNVQCPKCNSTRLDATDYPGTVKCCECWCEFGSAPEHNDPLYLAVKRFIREQTISCPETIYQCDWVVENSYEFIRELCDIVGYHQEDEGDE